MSDLVFGAPEIEGLIDAYWSIAYHEGMKQRTHDAPAGDAQRVRSAISDALASQATLIAELQGEDRWKDISTAPKDGTYILVHQKGVPEPSTTVCCWDEAWGIGGWWMCCDGKNPELPLRGPGPTLWHPIPALKGGLNGK